LIDRYTFFPHISGMALEIGDIFERIFGAFITTADPEVEKKKQLKILAKELSKSKYKW